MSILGINDGARCGSCTSIILVLNPIRISIIDENEWTPDSLCTIEHAWCKGADISLEARDVVPEAISIPIRILRRVEREGIMRVGP